MPIRSRCGYYDSGTTCQPRNLLKTVSNLGRASLHAYLQSWNGRYGVGTGLYRHRQTNAKMRFKKWRNSVWVFFLKIKVDYSTDLKPVQTTYLQ